MTNICKVLTIPLLVTLVSACQTTNNDVTNLNFKKGDTLQALVNVHGDLGSGKLYALNYQLPGMIPVCSDVSVESISSKSIKINYKGKQYDYLWDGHTRKAGQSLAENFDLYFGQKCDEMALSKLSEKDKEGLAQGRATLGMSKQGVIFATGYPPIHATPTTESNTWLYWRNKWGKRAIEFSAQGEVLKIR